MENLSTPKTEVISLRPAAVFALLHVLPFIVLSVVFLLLAWRYCPGFMWISLLSAVMGFYRFVFIRRLRYVITTEVISIARGIFFKRIDHIELYRVRDYIQLQPFLLQLLGLMDLCLKSTDTENPVIWLRGIPASPLVDMLREQVQAARLKNKVVEIT
jgi:uncharacterized membrane protein YdbT with pleckstrin-like domain